MDERQWEKDFFLRSSDFDCQERLKPSAVLDLFQDVAGEHADRLGIGFQNMLKRELMWVVARVKFELALEARPYQKVRVRTWPLPPRRAGFLRNYAIYNEAGDTLARGSSEWALMQRSARSTSYMYSSSTRFFASCWKASAEGAKSVYL